jgi:hypothetical protein
VVVAAAVLLAEFGSAVVALTAAWFVNVPDVDGAVTPIVIVDEAPAASEGLVQDTVPLTCMHVQPLPAALA